MIFRKQGDRIHTLVNEVSMKFPLSFILIVSMVLAQQLFGQASYKIPVTISNGTNQTVLQLGVNTGNTVGIDTNTTLGTFREVPAPPVPPAPFEWDARFMTIPGRVNIFPTGLSSGVWNDFRGYIAASQVDSFKIVISGDATDNASTTVSWPSDLVSYGTTWTIKPQAGSDWPTTNMLTSTSVVIDAGLHKNIIVIKVGAMGTNDVKFADDLLPTTYSLGQNYPNPFNPSTNVHFSLPLAGKTSLMVYNILGQHVATLLNEVLSAGNYNVSFNAIDLPSGMYFYRLQSAGTALVKKMTLVK